MSLLEIRGLRVEYPGADAPAVAGLELDVAGGESVGVVGESGSGKTQSALAILGLLSPQARVSGSIRFDDEELVGRGGAAAKLRARRIGMVFQDPLAALNPYLAVGEQLGLILRRHGRATRSDARRRATGLLERLGLPDPARQARALPGELSGGMRQRVMIAAALAAGPDLLIADEPTTALDATVQAQILTLLRELRRETGIALLLITHDLGIVAGNSDRLFVVDRGVTLESGPTRTVFESPVHPRTADMLRAARDTAQKAPDMMSAARKPLLDLCGIDVCYSERAGLFRARHRVAAVRQLGVRLRPGETLGIVGESGCGKTSLARAVLGLARETRGQVRFLGRELPARLEQRSTAQRRQLQLVFQNPTTSLNPAMTVRDSLAEPLKVHAPELKAAECDERVTRMLGRVGLDAALSGRYPHELSGGQAQRVAIARALIANPAVLVCDEAVASLDGTVRHGILKLLAEEQRRTALAILFISHDLNVVRQISHRVLVMYMGRLVELADTARLFERPRHPYTRALIDSIPVADPAVPPRELAIEGETPGAAGQLAGCAFHPRCRYATGICRAEMPALSADAGDRVACHRAAELDLGGGC